MIHGIFIELGLNYFMRQTIYFVLILILFFTLSAFLLNKENAELKNKEANSISSFTSKDEDTERNLDKLSEVEELQTDNMIDLQSATENYFKEKHFDTFATIFTPDSNVEINSKTDLDALSLIKFPVLLASYEMRTKKNLDFSTWVSRYNYSNQIDGAIYDMMVYSSNEATGAILTQVTLDYINSYLQEVIPNTTIFIDHTPSYAGSFGENYSQENAINTHDLTILVEKLFNYELFDQSTSDEIISILNETADYYSLTDIIDRSKIFIKTGYSPDTHFALTGMIDLPKYGKTFMTIYFTSDEYIDKKEIKNFIEYLINL